jgi:transcription termination/antitermination protein NusG
VRQGACRHATTPHRAAKPDDLNRGIVRRIGGAGARFAVTNERSLVHRRPCVFCDEVAEAWPKILDPAPLGLITLATPKKIPALIWVVGDKREATLVTEKAEGLPISLRHSSTPPLGSSEMPSQCRDLSWYAIRVKPNFEHVSTRLLRDKGFDEYLPLYRSRRRWSDRVKEIELPLFPRYLFCRMLRSQRTPVLSTPGVVCIVSCGSDPIPIPESEIHAIRILLHSGLPAKAAPFVNVGDRISIKQGPLAGVTGIVIAHKSEFRLVVSIPLLQRSVSVELNRAWVEAC